MPGCDSVDSLVLSLHSTPSPTHSQALGTTGRVNEPLPGEGVTSDINLVNGSETGAQIGKRRQRKTP